jgi:hypothetical protein
MGFKDREPYIVPTEVSLWNPLLIQEMLSVLALIGIRAKPVNRRIL